MRVKRILSVGAVLAACAVGASERAVPVRDGRVEVGAEDIHFEFRARAYRTPLEDASDAVLFVSRDASPLPPPKGATPVVYLPGALGAGGDSGFANHFFTSGESYVPTLVVRSSASATSPSRLAAQSNGRNGIFDASRVVIMGVLGVYAAGDDYGRDGIDHFRANPSWFLSHTGGSEEAAAFAQLACDVVRALPAKVRRAANADGMMAFSVLTLLRRAQYGVESDAPFFEGTAHRPALVRADIDRTRLLKMAAASTEYPVPPPAFIDGDFPSNHVLTAVADLSDAVFDHNSSVRCHVSQGFVVRKGVRSFQVRLQTALVDYARAEWRVLQGDPARVRIVPGGAKGEEATIEIRRHGIFDAPRLNGAGPLKTSRVDVGCFAVAGPDDVSVPAICSFEFPYEDEVTDVLEAPIRPETVVEAPKPEPVVEAPVPEPRGWAALCAVTAEAIRADGCCSEGLLDEWQAGAGRNPAAAARYAQAKIWAARLRISDLPEEVRKDQPQSVTGDARVEAFLCDFTGDGLGDLVVELRSDGEKGRYCHGFYARLPEGGYRSIGWKLENRGVCAVPCKDGRTAFVCASDDAQGNLRTALVAWVDGRMTYVPKGRVATGDDRPPHATFWPWKALK